MRRERLFFSPTLHAVAGYGPELMKPSVQINDMCQKDLLRAEYYALSPAKNDREVLRERALEKMQQLKDQMIQALRDTDTE